MDPTIGENYRRIKAAIDEVALERPPRDDGKEHPKVDLVVVSKLKPVQVIQQVYESLGHTIFGENYVQELVDKVASGILSPEIKFVFIGHLQKNKVKQLISKTGNHLIRIETLDSIELAQRLQTVCDDLNRTLDVMVQVNTSKESSKQGLMLYEDVRDLCAYVKKSCPNLKLTGLMTIASQSLGSEFSDLRDMAREIGKELGIERLDLSMGMSGDFREAILNGATVIRIGTAILGERPSK